MDSRLTEMRAIAIESVLQQLEAARRSEDRPPLLSPGVHRRILALVFPLMFWLKRVRGGRVDFVFDAHGLLRTCRGRSAFRRWSEVAEIAVFSTGILIELHEGAAIPIPYRVLSLADRATLLELFHDGRDRSHWPRP
ncbi:YcxB family protein [Ideonella sp.]|uniref:YcxB family protein n=1 Tax=Ideonella sp. TaxID=1929293 RepID=UPI0035B0B4F7